MIRTMQLLLMRHASAETAEGLPDHERPLTEQGGRDAAAMGRWLRDNAAVPEAVWCSSALRARQTWSAAAAALTGAPEPSYLRSVYQAGPGDLLELLRDVPTAVGSVLIVGHNPTLQQALAAITGEPPQSFPSGALALLELAGSWSAPGDARLVNFVRPDETGAP